MKEAEQTLLTPLLSLDTPGKATVQVVILADPVSSYYLKVTIIIYRYNSTFFYDFGLNDIYDIVLKFVIFTQMVQGRQNLMFYTTIVHKTNKQTDKTDCFTPCACVWGNKYM